MKLFNIKSLLLNAIMLGFMQTNVALADSPYKGMKANFIGDSITEGSSYVNTVKSSLGLSIARNYGIGGGSLVRRNSLPHLKDVLFSGRKIDIMYTPIVNRWEQMHNDADIIFMLIGTNDFSNGVPLGKSDSLALNEFNGGLNIVLPGLKKKYPGKLIIVSTLLKRVNGGAPLLPFNTAIREACKRHGMICYDAYTDSKLDLGNEYYKKIFKNTKDGLHPNAEGHKILGERIAKFIKKQAH